MRANTHYSAHVSGALSAKTLLPQRWSSQQGHVGLLVRQGRFLPQVVADVIAWQRGPVEREELVELAEPGALRPHRNLRKEAKREVQERCAPYQQARPCRVGG